MLMELLRREKNAGIKPDVDLDLFMKVNICAHTSDNSGFVDL